VVLKEVYIDSQGSIGLSNGR